MVGDATVSTGARTSRTVSRVPAGSASDIAITAQVMKWMQRWPFRSIAERKWFTTADAIELPDY
jgi:hypothetical protein